MNLAEEEIGDERAAALSKKSKRKGSTTCGGGLVRFKGGTIRWWMSVSTSSSLPTGEGRTGRTVMGVIRKSRNYIKLPHF